MASLIGNDILDMGTRKGRRQRGDPMAPEMGFGAPGQFDLPNVSDVRTVLSFALFASGDGMYFSPAA